MTTATNDARARGNRAERDSYSVAEFAAMHGLTRHVIYKRIKSGDLKAGRLWPNGQLRIFREEFMRQVAEQMEEEDSNV